MYTYVYRICVYLFIEAPISASSNDILSPTLPPPPPPPLPQNATPTHAPPPPDLSSPHLLPYMGVVNEAIGPTTPLQSYPGGWVTPGSTEGTPHPLQRTLMIQPQFSQVIIVEMFTCNFKLRYLNNLLYKGV